MAYDLSADRIVLMANEIDDPLKEIQKSGFKFPENGTKFVFRCFKRKNLPDDLFRSAFDLLERNMKIHYENSAWDWDADQKSEEMSEDAAYYLILTENQKFVGFCHFRFDLDYGVPVMYLYEIQLEKSFQNHGFGSKFLSILIEFARFTRMRKIVATVFKYNDISLKFFRKNHFSLDDTSPSEADYIIVSLIVQ